jgi:hypothetical protein
MRKANTNRYIHINKKGGANLSIHVRGSNIDFFRVLLKFAQVRHTNIPWAQFIAEGLKTYVNTLPPEDKAIFDAISTDYYNEKYGPAQNLIKNIPELNQ